MATHRISIELSDFAYAEMQKLIAAGDFTSDHELIQEAIESFVLDCTQNDGSVELPPWLQEEIRIAYDEDVAHPDLALTSEELDAYLARERSHPAELAKAS